MKKLLLVFAILLGFTYMASAQTKLGEFKFETEAHNFGKIAIGKPVVHTFSFTNVGDEPIIISKVETTCGCTVPEFTSTPVKKGETGTIKVTLTPSGPALPFVKTITVTSNARTPNKVLIIKGVYVE
ncbi:MAG: DUF1573 domain-containing protein [Pedobacter sp.]|nr:MAG: DUF1573 domain-containing protein [Pedobacter sp.]